MQINIPKKINFDEILKNISDEEELVEKISYLINDLKEMEGYIKYPKFNWKINCKMIYEYKNKNLIRNTTFIMNWNDFQNFLKIENPEYIRY